jgi:hypothetical protein
MRRRNIIFVAAGIAVIAFYLTYRWMPKGSAEKQLLIPATTSQSKTALKSDSSPRRGKNELGDTLMEAQDPLFLDKILPKLNGFFSTLDGLGVNPLRGALQPDSCGKIRVIHIPDGMICRLVIGDSWTAAYMENSTFSGIVYFGQRGEDDPIRAISHANTNALRRLAQSAVNMPESEVLGIANRVADAFGIDRSKFEKPQMIEEGLFDYHLGIYTVRYRKKGTDPVNQMNYTYSVSLKANSPTTAVLVGYSFLETTLP